MLMRSIEQAPESPSPDKCFCASSKRALDSSESSLDSHRMLEEVSAVSSSAETFKGNSMSGSDEFKDLDASKFSPGIDNDALVRFIEENPETMDSSELVLDYDELCSILDDTPESPSPKRCFSSSSKWALDSTKSSLDSRCMLEEGSAISSSAKPFKGNSKVGGDEFKVSDAPKFSIEINHDALIRFIEENPEALDSSEWALDCDELCSIFTDIPESNLNSPSSKDTQNKSAFATVRHGNEIASDSSVEVSRSSLHPAGNPLAGVLAGKLGAFAHNGSPIQASSVSPGDWSSGGDNSCHLEISEIPQLEIPTCSATSCKLIDIKMRSAGNLLVDHVENLGLSKYNSCASMKLGDNSSQKELYCQRPNAIGDNDRYPLFQDFGSVGDSLFTDTLQGYSHSISGSEYFTCSEDPCNEAEVGEVPSGIPCPSVAGYGHGGTSHSMVPVRKELDDDYGGDNYLSSIDKEYVLHVDGLQTNGRSVPQPSTFTHSKLFSHHPVGRSKGETIYKPDNLSAITWHLIESGKPVHEGSEYFNESNWKPLLHGTVPSASSEHHDSLEHGEEDMFASEGGCVSQDKFHQTASMFYVDNGQTNLKMSNQYTLCVEPSSLSEEPGFNVGKSSRKMMQTTGISGVGPALIHGSFTKSSQFGDSEVSIIESISHPAPPRQFPVVGNSVGTLQCSTTADSSNYIGVGSSKRKARDEQIVLKAALQDLSESKSEAFPPEGCLTVPLLRHQRIALSWMLQKETASSHCSGGILADDQGLGKTVSTIALILKERRQPIRSRQDIEVIEVETLVLDDERECGGMKQDIQIEQSISKNCSKSFPKRTVQAKGRPAAGTLVVCPTSVLRQWAEELNTKVTRKANLSVLVYHGGNRTKDPDELAKFDVVLTTYSIVSMEVPKQSLNEEDGDEKAEDMNVPPIGFCSKKRKSPPMSHKNFKGKKGMNKGPLELSACPLAKVEWFRVILDEAQSIKNHRTQVARACWGLRAKRRWCLSGTPIQNAVDDLYSYFRFLRYDPYAAYTLFCSAIKFPISRNPSKGFKKLQAVLKTVMLRRTKGTLLDGQPIITLPPKLVELRKVEFTKEERDFYTKLEADSRAQFEEYAAAGTVKENYVNILLMLLRLRQACDHPLLVKPYYSNSLWRSSVDAAKKLSREKQIYLLGCLEASLAICSVCNDPPEDAVVSHCGHVFCKQCICEHLSGDENQCPTNNCKVRFNNSLVFSKSSLNTALSDKPVEDGYLDFYGSDDKMVPDAQLRDSSKIKATLEVLQSLCKPRNYTSSSSFSLQKSDRVAGCSDNHSDSQAVEQHLGTSENHVSVDPLKLCGEKAIVFSQWTRMLDLLEACLKSSSIQYRRLDGTMSVMARDKAVKDFNTLPEVSVIIMSLKAASLGLNMVAACHVLLLDLWWNPTTEDQAIDRAHRIGQTRPVTVLRLTVKDTVEDRILALQQKKRELVSSAFGEDETGGQQSRLTVEDLKYLFLM